MHSIASRAKNGTEPITTLVEEFYGPDGPLVEAGWEIRPQQRTMSLDIANAYDDHHEAKVKTAWVTHEAPCGTGKGLAYLVPGSLIALRERAIWDDEDENNRAPSPPQMVVSTANITLQEQLIGKDIPALCDMLDTDFRYMLLKGRNNYICKREIAVASGDVMADERFARLLNELDSGSWNGDKESLTWEPAEFWSKVSRTSQECTGQGCPNFALGAEGGTCHWRTAIHGWKQAHIVVVNHHMLALQRGLNAALLAVDEMHELEDCVRSAVSGKLTRGTGVALARRAAKVMGVNDSRDLIEHPIAMIMDAIEEGFYRENPRQTRWPDPLILKEGWAGGKLKKHSEKLRVAYGEIRDAAVDHGCYEVSPGNLRPPSARANPGGAEEGARLGVLAGVLWKLYGRATAFATGVVPEDWPGASQPWALYADGNWDRSGRLWLTARSAPADVSWAITALQGSYPVAAMTSATVPDFKSLRLTFGMTMTGAAKHADDSDPWLIEARLPSPFPLVDMGVTVVPRGPSPKDARWREWAAQQVVELVKASDGRALILASSTAQMRKYGEALRQSTNYPVKVQGEEGRATLRKWFKETREGVLCATRSFFQGLDVQGDSCVLVVIDRIPFARPGDPVEDAVQRLLVDRAGGGSGYMLRSIPDAERVLAQGAGRLIRSVTDRGAVAVLDNRILKSSAGWRQLKGALPPFPTSYTIDDVRRVLAGEEIEGLPVVRARSNKIRWS